MNEKGGIQKVLFTKILEWLAFDGAESKTIFVTLQIRGAIEYFQVANKGRSFALRQTQ